MIIRKNSVQVRWLYCVIQKLVCITFQDIMFSNLIWIVAMDNIRYIEFVCWLTLSSHVF